MEYKVTWKRNVKGIESKITVFVEAERDTPRLLIIKKSLNFLMGRDNPWESIFNDEQFVREFFRMWTIGKVYRKKQTV